MTQQDQTRDYFRSAAFDWQNKSVNVQNAYSVIAGRNQAVLDVVGRTAKTGRFLDVGCGTGQLTIDVARQGWQSEGVDFAAEMIEQCIANAEAASVSADFRCGSFFDVEFEGGVYDVISAQGFIEYISPEQIDLFLANCARLLRPGGALVVGSRNRLFNVFSMNEFTRLEVEFGTYGVLVAEAVALQSSPSAEAAFAALRRFERIDPQPDHHPITGIPVETRYQFTPAELTFRLRRCGFTSHTLFPVHFHGLPLSVKEEHPGIHSEIAMIAAKIGFNDHRFVPQSSSFVIEARRGE